MPPVAFSPVVHVSTCFPSCVLWLIIVYTHPLLTRLLYFACMCMCMCVCCCWGRFGCAADPSGPAGPPAAAVAAVIRLLLYVFSCPFYLSYYS